MKIVFIYTLKKSFSFMLKSMNKIIFIRYICVFAYTGNISMLKLVVVLTVILWYITIKKFFHTPQNCKLINSKVLLKLIDL